MAIYACLYSKFKSDCSFLTFHYHSKLVEKSFTINFAILINRNQINPIY